MTAPDVNADVRARFDELFNERYPLNAIGAEDGSPYDKHMMSIALEFYLAAHADMAGEVRELVDEVREIADDLREWGSTDAQLATRAERLDAALAKLHPTHQEKP